MKKMILRFSLDRTIIKNTDISANIDSLFITEVVKGATAVLLSMEDVLSDNEETEDIPVDFKLEQNYPNPFNPSTVIRYGVPAEDANYTSSTNVSLKIYDILGTLVATLQDGKQAPGFYERRWNASKLASGMYLYVLRAGNYTLSRKMILLK